MGILTYAKLIGAAALVGGLIWLGATINGWRVEAKASRPAIAIQAEKIADQDRQLRGYEITLKELRAVNAIKDILIAESRDRGAQLEARLTLLGRTLAQIEAERRDWQARPYPVDCEATMRELALRGGAKP
jgi:chromosome segregation ATPase